MLKVGLILSHRSINLGRFKKSTRNVLFETKERWNHDVKESGLGCVELAFDYEGFRILDQAANSQEHIIERMLELKEKYDILIFMPLVDRRFGSGMKKELDAIKAANERLPKEDQIYIEPYIRKRFFYSDRNYPMLLDKGNTKLPIAVWYKNDEEFGNEVYKLFNGIVHNHPKAMSNDTAPSSSSNDKSSSSNDTAPNSSSNDKSSSSNDTASNSSNGGGNGKNRKWLWVTIPAAIFLAAVVLLYPYYSKKPILSPPDPPHNEVTIDTALVAFENSIKAAEALIHQGGKNQALEELTRLKGTCPREWPNLKAKIDSLICLIPPPPPCKPKPTITLDAFKVEANPSGFAASLSDGIKGNVPSIIEKGDNPRWIITVTEDDTAEEIFVKTAPNDWDKVKIRFVVSIVDATGKLTPKKTIVDTVGKSPNGIGAARTKARDAAAPKIVKTVTDYIK